MDLSNYIGKDLIKGIDSLVVTQGQSKDGAPYCYLSLNFINGFTKRIYIQTAENFAFNNLISILDNDRLDS